MCTESQEHHTPSQVPAANVNDSLKLTSPMKTKLKIRLRKLKKLKQVEQLKQLKLLMQLG